MLVSKQGVHFVHREVVGELPDVNDVLKACWQIVPEEKRKGLTLPQVDASGSEQAPACSADACAFPAKT